MTAYDPDDEPAEEYASPPCLMHLVEPASGRIGPIGDRRQWADVKR